MKNNAILLVGGSFDADSNGKKSSLIAKMHAALIHFCQTDMITCHNGGNYNELTNILNSTPNYDIVFWFANVDNALPKIRNVKEIAPRTMLVTSKRNDDNRYSFYELVQKTLSQKANLALEFSKIEDKQFRIRVFDPLGCMWAETTDIETALYQTLLRLDYLKSVTRQSTIQSKNTHVAAPDEQAFVNIVRKYAQEFQACMPDCKTERFVGNASMKIPVMASRCSKGMPSFRKNGYVFVSKRNIDKQFIEIQNFVPVYTEKGQLYYCGEDKPSVDTPVQVRLYDALPNIYYMLHSHCYLKDTVFTDNAVPCGAIEEVDEILSKITDRKQNTYKLNLKGHGSLVMAHDLSTFDNLQYVARKIPEKCVCQKEKTHNET